MGSFLKQGPLEGTVFIRMPYYIGDLKRDLKFGELPKGRVRRGL